MVTPPHRGLRRPHDGRDAPTRSCGSAARARRDMGGPDMRRQSYLRRLVSLGLAVWLAGALVACSNDSSASPAPTPSAAAFFLLVVDIDGPPVDIQINGKSAGSAVCYAARSGPDPTFAPSNTQPLPWSVVVLRHGGRVLATFQEDGGNGPRTVFVRANGVTEAAYGANPGPAPAASCAP